MCKLPDIPAPLPDLPTSCSLDMLLYSNALPVAHPHHQFASTCKDSWTCYSVRHSFCHLQWQPSSTLTIFVCSHKVSCADRRLVSAVQGLDRFGVPLCTPYKVYPEISSSEFNGTNSQVSMYRIAVSLGKALSN